MKLNRRILCLIISLLTAFSMCTAVYAGDIQEVTGADTAGLTEISNIESYENDGRISSYENETAQIDGIWYAFDSNGNIIKNATPVINGKKYFCTGTGELLTGWVFLGKWKMYFDPDTKAAAIGFCELPSSIDSSVTKTFLFDNNGVMQNFAGTTTLNTTFANGKYWFSTDEASLKTGWLHLGIWYLYFDPDTYAALTSCTANINGSECTYDKNGVLTSGTVITCSHTYGPGITRSTASCLTEGVVEYTCSKCGNVKTVTTPALGHLFADGICSRCGAKEEARNCIAQADGKWYAYDENGRIIKGATPTINGSKYYCTSTGELGSGWLNLGGWKLYFDSETHAAVTGYRLIDGKGYLFDENGIQISISLSAQDEKICSEYVSDGYIADIFVSIKTNIFDNPSYGYDLMGAYRWCVDWITYDLNDNCDWTGLQSSDSCPWTSIGKAANCYFGSDYKVDWSEVVADGLKYGWLNGNTNLSDYRQCHWASSTIEKAPYCTMSEVYAIDTFAKKSGTKYAGDCRGYAAIFRWAAKFLGYDAKFMYGELNYNGLCGDHAWVEIDGKIYDTQADNCSGTQTLFYGMSYSSDPWGRGVHKAYAEQD